MKYTYRVFTSQLLKDGLDAYTLGGHKTFDTLAQAEKEAAKQAKQAAKCSYPWSKFHTVINKVDEQGWGSNVLTIEVTKGS